MCIASCFQFVLHVYTSPHSEVEAGKATLAVHILHYIMLDCFGRGRTCCACVVFSNVRRWGTQLNSQFGAETEPVCESWQGRILFTSRPHLHRFYLHIYTRRQPTPSIPTRELRATPSQSGQRKGCEGHSSTHPLQIRRVRQRQHDNLLRTFTHISRRHPASWTRGRRSSPRQRRRAREAWQPVQT